MKKSKYYHFIGIGGAGMAPMAIIMKEKGYCVSGSDITESKNLAILAKKDVKILKGPHHAENLPADENLIVISSSAIATDNPEVLVAKKRGLQIFRRGEFLAKIAESYPKSIAVGGSHGKTTITAMTVHCLKKLGHNPGFMIGGKVKTWKAAGSAGDGKIFVTESDESDGTNKFMNATVSIISNLDDDHEWNFKGGLDELYANFAKFAQNSKILIYGRSPIADKILGFHTDKKPLCVSDTIYMPAQFHSWADFQKLNALLAANAVCRITKAKIDEALNAILDFPGVERRMSVRFRSYDTILIEDYAHHPAELAALTDSLLKMKENRELHIIFQPHRYARLKKYFHQFVCELCKADKVTVLPVFSAWCPDDEVNSQKLVEELNKTRGDNFANFADDDFASLAAKIANGGTNARILAIVGAGDCDRLVDEVLKMSQLIDSKY